MDLYNLADLHQEHAIEIEDALLQCARSGRYILGGVVEELEQELANKAGFTFVLGTSSGSASLLLAFLACGIGREDEVITPAFGFIAAAEMLLLIGAKPVLVDIDSQTYHLDLNALERAITPKTKAIVPLSLFGIASDRYALKALAKAYNLVIIEDCAQSFLAPYDSATNDMPDILTTSFFPTKPLGCYGDGGAVFCNDVNLYAKLKALRVHGQSQKYSHIYLGLNARLDALQASILKVKFKYYKTHLERLRALAKIYHTLLSPLNLQLPLDTIQTKHCTRQNIYSQYPILHPKRDKLVAKLKQAGIQTAIHYPKPLHHQEALKHLGYPPSAFPNALSVSKHILSLPLNTSLSMQDLEKVAQIIAYV
ncbi:DegT/DnrJ/EryC1/StrS family aminotransferase [Helicobacter suis]|uniref:DegT/DnrJ/EryC1/StrS family aminotransferase n=1 Tax=Helicobacter suis TaxID=104628 RepID=UPI0013CFDF60|nr:DegT/DnrJ/EryC1/StrS family aminotransferase [Helicobacter suis]